MKKKRKKAKPDKKERAGEMIRKTPEHPENEAPYGGMDFTNFRKNLGCGG